MAHDQQHHLKENNKGGTEVRLPHLGKKKYIAGALAAGMIMAGGGIAFAYFGASGTGTGTASTSTPTNVIVTVTHITFTGASTEQINFKITNPNAYKVHLGKFKITTATVTGCGTVHTNPTLVKKTTASATIGTIAA
ncbi:MAG: hypothetical protein ACRD6W_18465, partial [Nitrososphaerales archaeon]